MNLIVAVAIILLNLYVAYGISRQIPHAVLSICFPDVSTSICVEADLKAPHECKHSPYRCADSRTRNNAIIMGNAFAFNRICCC